MPNIHNDIVRFCQHASREFSKFFQSDSKITFSKIKTSQGNLYIVDESTLHMLKGNISSYSLEPIGLILEKNDGDYLYYSFSGEYENMEKIVKEFVRQCLI